MLTNKNLLQTLEVFKYACVSQSQSEDWDLAAIVRIDAKLTAEPELQRLHALIFKNANKRDQLRFFSQATQNQLKLNTFNLIVDMVAKNNELTSLSQALKSTNIQLLLIKGLAFQGHIYSADAPRGASDIDLFISPEDKTAFIQYFEQVAAPVQVKYEHTFDGLFEETWQAKNSQTVYFDLHWHLTYPSLFKFNENAIKQQSITQPLFKDGNIRLLSNEDHLVFLATHFVKDCNFYGYGLIDCHELISQKNVNLIVCFEKAGACGVKTGVYFMLLLCQRHLFTPISISVLKDNKPHFIRAWLCNIAVDYILIKSAKLKSKHHRIKQIVTQLLFCDKLTRVLIHHIKYLKMSTKNLIKNKL